MTNDYHGPKFIALVGGRRMLTPLALVLIVIEAMDLVFAVDSIPAVLAITRDTFIVYTSNICAILGLRSLYFLLANLVTRFIYLRIGLAIILCFVGIKMLVEPLGQIAELAFAPRHHLRADRHHDRLIPRDQRRGGAHAEINKHCNRRRESIYSCRRL